MIYQMIAPKDMGEDTGDTWSMDFFKKQMKYMFFISVGYRIASDGTQCQTISTKTGHNYYSISNKIVENL